MALGQYNLWGKRKFLKSKESNLESILELLREGAVEEQTIVAVLVDLTVYDLVAAAHPRRRELLMSIFREVAKFPNIVFTYEDNLMHSFSGLDGGKIVRHQTERTPAQSASDPLADMDFLLGEDYGEYCVESYHARRLKQLCLMWGVPWDPPALATAAGSFIDELSCIGLNLVPFRRRTEVAVLVQRFMQDTLSGTIMEMYVSKDRALALEFDKFITMFHRYLSELRGKSVSVERIHSARSIIYRFKTHEMTAGDLSVAMDQFKEFVSQTDKPLGIIHEAITSARIPEIEANRLVRELQRDWRRLKLDIQMSMERSVLDLKEKYLNEVLDAEEKVSAGGDIVLSAAMPEPIAVLGLGGVTFIGGSHHVTIGAGQPTANSGEIDEAIDRYAKDEEKAQLKTAAAVLDDKTLPKEQRLPILKRLQTFVYKDVLPKMGDAATKILIEVLENKMGLGN